VKTLLISGSTPVPGKLVEIIERGSTSVARGTAVDVSRQTFDRIVFWAGPFDRALADAARTLATREAREHREAIVFVCEGEAGPLDGVPANEQYVWPQDEDRLEMAFMTGA
jgi:hypothetical protein